MLRCRKRKKTRSEHCVYRGWKEGGGGSLVGAFVVGRGGGGGLGSIMCVYISHSVHLSVCLSICHVQMMIHNIVYIEKEGGGWHEGLEVYLYNVCVSVFIRR